MTLHPISRTEHEVPGAPGVIRPGGPSHAEANTDLNGYLRPLEAAHALGLHGAGVASGLAVTPLPNAAGVRISPGVAVDGLGRHLVLAPGGSAETADDPAQSSRLVPVGDAGAELSTAGRSGSWLVVAQWRETSDATLPGAGFVVRQTPWLHLLAVESPDGGPAPAPPPDAVVLAAVLLDASGRVAADGLAPGPRISPELGTGRLRLRAPAVTAAAGVADTDVAQVAPRPGGGLRVRVPAADDPALSISGDGLVGIGTDDPGVTLDVAGPAAIDGELRVADAVDVAGSATVDGSCTVGGAMTVHGPAALRGAVTVDGAVSARGPVAVGGALDVAGPITCAAALRVAGALSATGPVTAAGSLSVTGRVGIGVPDPGFGLDVADRIRLRRGGSPSAGMWLHQGDPGADRAFVGLADDDEVGFWGNTGIGWGLRMNTTNGRVDITGDLAVAGGDLSLRKSSGGSASFTNATFDNEAELGTANLKLVMGTAQPLLGGPALPPFQFMIGYMLRLGVTRRFVRLFGVDQNGNATFAGGKGGYVVDHFRNAVGADLEQGDVVVLRPGGPVAWTGTGGAIPVPEVDLADRPYDQRVCGIVADVVHVGGLPWTEPDTVDPDAEAAHPLADTAADPDQPRTTVRNGQLGRMVTLGAFAHCKVDADVAAIEPGDPLTTSPTPGHAQKATDRDRAAGAVIGKAMAALPAGRGSIPVLVSLR